MPAPKSGQESMPRGPFNAHSGAGFGERGVSEVLAAPRQKKRRVQKCRCASQVELPRFPLLLITRRTEFHLNECSRGFENHIFQKHLQRVSSNRPVGQPKRRPQPHFTGTKTTKQVTITPFSGTFAVMFTSYQQASSHSPPLCWTCDTACHGRCTTMSKKRLQNKRCSCPWITIPRTQNKPTFNQHPQSMPLQISLYPTICILCQT